ncbi:sensor histidine kinase [Paenibacillus woosongensis]|uniref:sensor histidine kinase n=1 Tax=Paenibacillus woosongensis TaxID=307580 RepID=UPI0018C21E69|nr:sensor histidine kinase [Paenibacillus woosongensis]
MFIVALIFLCDAAMPPVSSTSGYIITLFLSKFMMFMLAFILVRVTKAYGNGTLTAWHWIFLFCCPFISIICIVQLSTNLLFRTNPVLFPITSTGLLMINFLMFVLCDRVVCVQSIQNKSRLLEQQNAYYVNQYFLTKEMQEESIKFQHDFKNILLGLRAKLQSGESEKGIKELDQLLGNIEKPLGISNNGNIIIDSIINYKSQVAAKNNIPFYLDVNIPPRLDLDTTLISVLLGNALDNAIEACKEKNNSNGYIKIQLHYLNESLFIRISNPYVNVIRTNIHGEICSSKSARSRGIGLKSIKKLVDDNQGLLEISYNNNIFQVRANTRQHKYLGLEGCKKMISSLLGTRSFYPILIPPKLAPLTNKRSMFFSTAGSGMSGGA